MKKLLLALPLLALAACGVEPTDPAPVAAPEPLTDDEVYLGTLRIGDIAYGDGEAAIELGGFICEAFLEGNTAAAIAGTITPAGYSQDDADYIVDSAVDTYCPEFA